MSNRIADAAAKSAVEWDILFMSGNLYQQFVKRRIFHIIILKCGPASWSAQFKRFIAKLKQNVEEETDNFTRIDD